MLKRRWADWVLRVGIAVGVLPWSAQAEQLRFRIAAHPKTLDWTLAHTSQETYFIMNMMEGLVALEGSAPVPRLAQSWKVADAGKTLEFALRDDVVWSDGRPLVAQHFVDSWARLIAKKTRSRSAYLFHDVASFSAPNARTLVIKLKHPVPSFLATLSFWPTFPIRLDLIKKWAGTWTDAAKLVTLGPYRLKSRQGNTYRLERNARYRRAPGTASDAPPDSIEAVVIEQEAQAKAAFFEGQFDFLLGAETTDLLQAQGRPDLQTRFFDYFATYYLGFDQRDPSFKEVELRKSVALAIDRSALPGILKGGQLAAKGWIPPGMEGFGFQMSMTFSAFEARAALARARQRLGDRAVSVRLGSEPFDGSAALQVALCERVRTLLEIACQPEPSLDNANVFVRHWGADIPDPINFFEVWTSRSNIKYLHWSSAAYDRSVAGLAAEVEPSARLRLMREAESTLTDGAMAILPLFYAKTAALLGPKVKSLQLTPMNYFFFDQIQTRDTVSP